MPVAVVEGVWLGLGVCVCVGVPELVGVTVGVGVVVGVGARHSVPPLAMQFTDMGNVYTPAGCVVRVAWAGGRQFVD